MEITVHLSESTDHVIVIIDEEPFPFTAKQADDLGMTLVRAAKQLIVRQVQQSRDAEKKAIRDSKGQPRVRPHPFAPSTADKRWCAGCGQGRTADIHTAGR